MFRSEWRHRVALLSGAVACLVAAAFFADPLERRLLWRTLQFVFAVEVVALPLATLLAYLIARTNLRFRPLALMLLSSLLFIPLYLQLCGWDAAFGRLGWFTVAFSGLRSPLIFGWRGAALIHAIYAIPWSTCLLIAVFARHDREAEEAALLEGNAWDCLRWVTFPQLAGGVLVAGLWIFIITAGEMTVTNIYLVPTYAEEVYNFYATSADVQAATLHYVPLALFTSAVVLCSLATLSDRAWNADQLQPLRWQLPQRNLVSWSALIFVVTLLALPLLSQAQRLGSVVVAVNNRPQRTWSASKAALVLSAAPGKFSDEFLTTLALSSAVCATVVPLGGMLAWMGVRRARIGFILWPLMIVAMAIPAPIVGLTVIWLFNHDHPLLIWLYDRTLVPPTVAIAVRALPVCFAAFWWSFSAVKQATLDAAALDGAGSVRRLLSIVLPSQWPTMLATLAAAFAIASGDISASILALPNGMETLSRRMFGLIHAGVDDQVAAIGLLSWIGYLVVACAIGGLLRYYREWNKITTAVRPINMAHEKL